MTTTIKHDLKTIVKSPADIESVRAGGVVVYVIHVEDTNYMLEIDLADKHDVGASSTFMAHYDKSVILMRWIRRAIESNTLYAI